MLVWSYRTRTHSKKSISDFEYLGFSTFWGILLVMTINEILKNVPDQMVKLLSNPFASAITFSVFGLMFGCIGAEILSLLKLLREFIGKKKGLIKDDGKIS